MTIDAPPSMLLHYPTIHTESQMCAYIQGAYIRKEFGLAHRELIFGILRYYETKESKNLVFEAIFAW